MIQVFLQGICFKKVNCFSALLTRSHNYLVFITIHKVLFDASARRARPRLGVDRASESVYVAARNLVFGSPC
jgi:hypothetical protein